MSAAAFVRRLAGATWTIIFLQILFKATSIRAGPERINWKYIIGLAFFVRTPGSGALSQGFAKN